jgi:cation:H+ antiporter
MIPDLASLSLGYVVATFAAAAALIATAGVWMVSTADRLADRTGLGEAITGAVFLGICTSLSGTITSVTAAADGFAGLSVSNAVGGIAVQTFFLALADIYYREANLEHAAASATNLVQCVLLMALLSVPLIAMALPAVTLWQIHPASAVLVAAYLLGLRLAHSVQTKPLWGPARTAETRPDEPREPPGGRPLKILLTRFVMLAALLTVAGFIIARSGEALAIRTGLSQTLVGVLLTAVATSLPELVTTLAAVQRRALTLAVGGIIGGNTFDVLFLALSDGAYRGGSIYHAIGPAEQYVISLTLLLTAIVLLGLLRRETYGFANIGFESLLVIVVYGSGIAALFLIG